MFKIDKPFDTLSRPAIISIPVDNEIVKLDIVDKMGLGIWFADTELPSIMILFEKEEEAIECMKGFKRSKLKCKMKVIDGKHGEENEHS